jgi:uncharacterized protein (DUF885 family)
MVKKFVPLALVVLALAAVPVAFGDDGSNPNPGSTTPVTQTQGPGQRLQQLRDRLQQIAQRFAKHCGTGATGAPQQCVTFAQKVETKLTQLDTNIQAKIVKLQACTSTSTDAYCKNADKKVALLQKIDARVQAAIQKVQAWLNGTSTTSSTSDSGLDQAAAGLGQLTQQAGGVTP